MNTIKNQLNPHLLFELTIGPTRMAVLKTTIEMNLSDLLEKEQNPKELATTLKVKPDEKNLVYFLDAMVAIGFAHKKDGKYFNTDFAKAFLLKDSPTYLGGMVENISQMQHRNLDCIEKLILTGPPKIKKQDRLDQEEKWKKSARDLANYQRTDIANRAVQIISNLPECSDIKRMLDLGCGPGGICMKIVSKIPTISGVLCDMPAMIEVAKEEIKAANLESRIETIAGDYNEVNFGNNYDLIWTSQTLYYAKDLKSMFSRIYEALNPGGIYISLHEGLTCERTNPANIVLSRLSLALEGQDVSFAEGEIASYLPEAGFSSIDTKIIKMPFGETELIIARKRR